MSYRDPHEELEDKLGELRLSLGKSSNYEAAQQNTLLFDDMVNKIQKIKMETQKTRGQLSEKCAEVKELQEFIECKEKHIQNIDRECGGHLSKIKRLQDERKTLLELMESDDAKSESLKLIAAKTQRIEELENAITRRRESQPETFNQESIEKVLKLQLQRIQLN